MSILDVLKKMVDDTLREEGITPELLEVVDLEVAYSPVLAFRGERLDHAVEARPWGFVPDGVLPERFEVMHGMCRGSIGRDELKVMRLRWLLAQKASQQPFMDAFLGRLREGK